MQGPGTKIQRGHVLPTQNCLLTAFYTLPPFYHACRTVSLLFLVAAFQDSLTMEEPVKVLKVAW